jgi:hypothetical protein
MRFFFKVIITARDNMDIIDQLEGDEVRTSYLFENGGACKYSLQSKLDAILEQYLGKL